MHVFTKTALAAVALLAAGVAAPSESQANWNGHGDFTHLKGKAIGTAVTLGFEDYSSTKGGKYYNFDWTGVNGNVGHWGGGNSNYSLLISGTSGFSFSSHAKFGVSSFKYIASPVSLGDSIRITLYTDAAMKTAHPYEVAIGLFSTGGTVNLSALTGGLSSNIYKIAISRTGTFGTLAVDGIATTVVPLPAALPLLGSALVLTGLLGRRLRRKAS